MIAEQYSTQTWISSPNLSFFYAISLKTTLTPIFDKHCSLLLYLCQVGPRQPSTPLYKA